jgi:hypothetical protein
MKAEYAGGQVKNTSAKQYTERLCGTLNLPLPGSTTLPGCCLKVTQPCCLHVANVRSFAYRLFVVHIRYDLLNEVCIEAHAARGKLDHSLCET